MKLPYAIDDSVALAVDVGGTNTSCALVAARGRGLSPLLERRFSTKAEPSLIEPLARFLEEAKATGLPPPGAACVSGAGPVEGGRRIRLTNAAWDIDGDAVEALARVPTMVINDFSAIAWGVLLLDPDDPAELAPLPPPCGPLPQVDARGPLVVIGAGTGLGFGFAFRDGAVPRVYPSEGGHACLPAYDDETRALARWLQARYGYAAGAEAGVSGQGIANIYEFLTSGEGDGIAPTGGPARVRDALGVMAREAGERPAAVATGAASGDPACTRAMDLFVRLYARVAADAASTFLPTGGIFLAGGVASKNIERFVEGHRFMETFLRGYREHVRAIAAATPVFVVRDYSISLYGDAFAALAGHGAGEREGDA